MSPAHLRRMCILLLLDAMSWTTHAREVPEGQGTVQPKLPLLTCRLVDLVTVDSGILRSPTITVSSVFPFRSVSICLIYIGAPIYLQLLYLRDLLTHLSLYNDLFISCYPLARSVLSDVSIATPVLFWFPLAGGQAHRLPWVCSSYRGPPTHFLRHRWLGNSRVSGVMCGGALVQLRMSH